jgi:hypothetical protein
MKRTKSAIATYAAMVMGWMLFFLPIAWYVRTNFGLEIGYIRLAVVVLILALISLFAWWVFSGDRLPAWLRIILGYLILLAGTLVVRRALGVWLFRRFVVLWVFALIAALVYSVILILVRVKQKKQEKDFNSALENVHDKQQ